MASSGVHAQRSLTWARTEAVQSKGLRLSQSHRTRTQTTYNLQPKETPGALNDPCLSRPVGASQHRPPTRPAQPHGRTLQVSSVERVCWERLSKH